MSDEPEIGRNLKLLGARGKAYSNGDYELSDWEGFTCPDCDWRGLSAPINDDWGLEEDGSILVCAECESEAVEQACEGDLDFDKVEAKLSDEYL